MIFIYTIKYQTSNDSIDALSIEELKEISSVFEEDVYKEISLETCVEKRLTHGAPSALIMRRQVEDNEKYLNYIMARGKKNK